MFIAPESSRWLFSKDRVEEARALLIKYHDGNDESFRLVAFELPEIQSTLQPLVHAEREWHCCLQMSQMPRADMRLQLRLVQT